MLLLFSIVLDCGCCLNLFHVVVVAIVVIVVIDVVVIVVIDAIAVILIPFDKINLKTVSKH